MKRQDYREKRRIRLAELLAKPAFSRCSLGRNRWFCAIWPRFPEGYTPATASGYGPSRDEAVTAANLALQYFFNCHKPIEYTHWTPRIASVHHRREVVMERVAKGSRKANEGVLSV